MVANLGGEPGWITRLEASLGARLLERTTRRLRLTDAGRTYLEYAQRAVDDLAQGTDRVRELQREPRGRIRVGRRSPRARRSRT